MKQKRLLLGNTQISGIGSASPISEPLNQPQDDDDASSAAIFEFYAERTGNPVRASDRQTLAQLCSYPEHVVKAGILLSLLRSRSRINSLKYCVGAIEECAQQKAGEEYFNYLLGQCERRSRQVQPGLPGVGAEVAEGNFASEEEAGARRAGGEGR